MDIFRSTLNDIYFGKTKDIVNGLRSVNTLQDPKNQKKLVMDLQDALSKRETAAEKAGGKGAK